MMEDPTSRSERYSLRWNNYANNLLQMITEQHMNEKFVDVVLICEYHYLKVHRLILSACSLFFESILENHIGQVFQPYIVLTDVKYEHLKYIIDFMYTGEIKVLDRDIEDVLALGEKFQVKGLCSVVLKEKVCINPEELSNNIDSKKGPQSTNQETQSVGQGYVSPPNKSILNVPPLPPLISSATKTSPHNNSLLGINNVYLPNTPELSAAITTKEIASASSTQINSLSANVTNSSTKILPKIQIRPPSVINASAAAKETCCGDSNKVSNTQKDLPEASTKSLENLEVNKQTNIMNMLKAPTTLDDHHAVDTSNVSCGLKVSVDSSRCSADSSKDITDMQKKSANSSDHLVMKGQPHILPKMPRLDKNPLVCYEGAQSNTACDLKAKRIILKRVLKKKRLPVRNSPNMADNKLLTSTSTVKDDSANIKKLLASIESYKLSANDSQITEKMESKDDVAPKPPDNFGHVVRMDEALGGRPTKVKLTSPTGKAIEVIPLEHLVAMTSVSGVEDDDEVTLVVKEEMIESEVSNRQSLIRDNMDVMKNGTQVPKKLLEDEHRKSSSPFMLFADEWRGKIASEHPDENKRQISLRISDMWKSLEPDNRKIYYKRARQGIKEESTSLVSVKRRKTRTGNNTVTDSPKKSNDFDVIICSDGESLNE